MPDTFQSIAVILLFLLPGFLMNKVFLEKGAYTTPSEIGLVLRSIYASSIIHVIFSPWSVIVYDLYTKDLLFGQFIYEFIAWFFIVILVSPIFFGWLLSWLSTKESVDKWLSYIGLSLLERCPQAWDAIFQENEGYWVIIDLKGNGKIAGRFGIQSVVSLSPSSKDIYIQEVWDIDADENFTKILQGTKGVWLDGNDIQSIKFFE